MCDVTISSQKCKLLPIEKYVMNEFIRFEFSLRYLQKLGNITVKVMSSDTLANTPSVPVTIGANEATFPFKCFGLGLSFYRDLNLPVKR